jgi:hypothetical protein
MKKTTLLLIALTVILLAFKKYGTASDYSNSYNYGISDLQKTLEGLETLIRSSDLSNAEDVLKLQNEINFCRTNINIQLNSLNIYVFIRTYSFICYFYIYYSIILFEHFSFLNRVQYFLNSESTQEKINKNKFKGDTHEKITDINNFFYHWAICSGGQNGGKWF